MVFDGRGVQGMGRTAIYTWGEGRSGVVWYESNTEGHSGGVFPGRIPKDERSAYSRNVGGSTLRVPVEVLFHGAYLRNVGGSTLRVGSVTYDEISRTRPHRAALRHPFVRTRTKTKHLHNAKKGLWVDSKLLGGPGWVLNDHRWCPGIFYKRTFNCIC